MDNEYRVPNRRVRKVVSQKALTSPKEISCAAVPYRDQTKKGEIGIYRGYHCHDI
jgi:hypothetical protein